MIFGMSPVFSGRPPVDGFFSSGFDSISDIGNPPADTAKYLGRWVVGQFEQPLVKPSCQAIPLTGLYH
jgi:hypothetical protein